MGNTNILTRLLMGQGHGDPLPAPTPLSQLLMNQTIVPSPDNNPQARRVQLRPEMQPTPEAVFGGAGERRPMNFDPVRFMMEMAGGPSMAMFAGPMAKTANQQMLARAKEMFSQRATPEQIWKETGWFTGADGKWRFEIPDAGLKVNQGQGSGVGALSPVSHPELAKAYPQLENMSIEVRPITDADTAVGMLRPAPWPFRPSLKVREGELYPSRQTAAHELQHGVQNIEGFASGSNTAMAPWRSPQTVLDNYRRSAGEVEARNVEKRLGMSARERGETPPWMTQDVETERQIVSKPGFFDKYGLPLGLAGTAYGAYGIIDALLNMQKKTSP